MAAKAQPYSENGVTVSKSTIYVGDEILLKYSGLLVQNGAQTLYAHVGYGEEWEEKSFIPMTREGEDYVCPINVLLPGTLNVCFKDNADNWDNNSNTNYIFKITKKPVRTSASAALKKDEAEIKTKAKIETKAKTKSKAEDKMCETKPTRVKSRKEG